MDLTKLSKRTVIIAGAILSIIAYLFFPVFKASMSGWGSNVYESVTGYELCFGYKQNEGRLEYLFPVLISALVLFCHFKPQFNKYLQYATWAMGIGVAFLLAKKDSALGGSVWGINVYLEFAMGAYLYIICAVAAIAAPYIKQIPEDAPAEKVEKAEDAEKTE